MKYIVSLLCLIPAMASADTVTAKKSGCLRCHHPTRKLTGPTMQQLAEKFTLSDVDSLVVEVKRGRKGADLTWGRVKMPPSKAPEADIKKVIEWMLTQK